jgi:hypothetical protein
MRTFIALNEVLRFAFELVALAAFGWGAASSFDGPVRFVVAAVAVIAGAALWGALVAPRASRRLRDPARLGLEVVFFALAGGCLAVVGHPVIGVVFAVLAIANAVLLRRHDGVLGAIS